MGSLYCRRPSVGALPEYCRAPPAVHATASSALPPPGSTEVARKPAAQRMTGPRVATGPGGRQSSARAIAAAYSASSRPNWCPDFTHVLCSPAAHSR